MEYSGKYCAYLKANDGTVTLWGGLRKTQAQWRYHWINRRLHNEPGFSAAIKEFGWKREFTA